MVGSLFRLAAAAGLCIALAGCASGPDYDDDGGDYADGPVAHSGRTTRPDSPLQCVPYARDHSGVTIFGDAYTWWDKAAGRFSRSGEPREGAVMVLHNYAGPNRGHVAVVRDLIDSRTIKIDHANWLDDGAIYTDDPVRDVSAANDWSQVKVFNLRTGAWGSRVYPVQGFIGPGRDSGNGGSMTVAHNGSGPGRDFDNSGDVTVVHNGGGRDAISALVAGDDPADLDDLR